MGGKVEFQNCAVSQKKIKRRLTADIRLHFAQIAFSDFGYKQSMRRNSDVEEE